MAKAATEAVVDPIKDSLLALLLELSASVEDGSILSKGELKRAFIKSINKG